MGENFLIFLIRNFLADHVIYQSKFIGKIYVAPGNSGTSSIAINLPLNINNHNEIKDVIISHLIDLLIIGPEGPLVKGLHNKLANMHELANLTIIGPKKEGAQLEGSKEFSKKFMKKYKIPTADFKTFNSTEISDAINYLKQLNPPFVIKANGLAAGKGVLICDSFEQAENGIKDMMINLKFGDAGETIVIEEFLDGIEMSVFIITDGESYKVLPTAKDYKRIGEYNTGLNTGGMGAISPVPFIGPTMMKKIKSQIIEPTLAGLKKEKIDYTGFIFFGLINVKEKPFVIEYNVRLGDPETQAIIPRIKSDLLLLLNKLNDKEKFKNEDLIISSQTTATVIMASGGYPERYQKNHIINGLENIKDTLVFHAGIKLEKEKYLTNGGRVLALTSFGASLSEAKNKSYQEIKKIKFKDLYYRKDIGLDLIK